MGTKNDAQRGRSRKRGRTVEINEHAYALASSLAQMTGQTLRNWLQIQIDYAAKRMERTRGAIEHEHVWRRIPDSNAVWCAFCLHVERVDTVDPHAEITQAD